MADNATRAGPRLSRRARRDDDPKMIGNWRIGRTIGKGSSGRVKIAKHARTGQYAAIKIVSKHALVNSRLSMADAAETAEKILLGIEREIVIMKLIDHPNVLKLYDVWETTGELYLIMEYVEGGELFDYLVSRSRLPVVEALHYFQQIIYAVDYCHRFNIAHRDLKPENLLLDKSRNIKVADFGMAAWEGGVGMLETSCGSPHYASPEVVEGKSYHGSTSDIWSCGVILFALLAGRLPFDDENIRHLLEKVKIAKFTMPTDIEPAAQHLISRMLEKDVTKRITMPEIMQHPFFLSRPPRSSAGVVPPPSLVEVERPVESIEEIDADIFGNLRTLWHGAPDEEIIEGLTNSEKTWEKAVYHLLLKYRARHLENYNMDEEDEDVGTKSRRATGVTGAAFRKTSTKPPGTTEAGNEQPSLERPSPPTPRKALQHSHVCDSGATATKALAVAPGTSPNQSPTRPCAPLGPRPQVLSQVAVDGAFQRRSTPSVDRSLELDPRAGASGGASGESLVPAINIPELQDESVQRFFQQIVEHLGTMQVRQSLVVPTVVPAGHNSSSAPKVLLAPATSAPPPTPATGTFDFTAPPTLQTRRADEDAEMGRFADADDDDTASATSTLTCSARVSNNGGSHMAVPAGVAQPSFGLGLSHYEPLPTPGPGMFAHLQATRDAPPRPLGLNRGASALKRPALPMQSIQRRSTGPTARTEESHQNAVLQPARNQTAGAHSLPSQGVVPRPRAMTQYQPQAERSPAIHDKENIAERRRTVGEKHVQIVLPETSAKTLKKKKSTSAMSAASDSSFFLPPPSAPRRSWFNNIFSFKPANYQLLSVYDAQVTREECRRVLASIGVQVTPDGSGMLKCRLDEIRDPAGVMAVAKAVRFRVELHGVPSTHAHGVAGYITSLTMVQEKGALSSFKLVYNRLRREWDLDAPRTPTSILDTPKPQLSVPATSAFNTLLPPMGSRFTEGYTTI